MHGWWRTGVLTGSTLDGQTCSPILRLQHPGCVSSKIGKIAPSSPQWGSTPPPSTPISRPALDTSGIPSLSPVLICPQLSLHVLAGDRWMLLEDLGWYFTGSR